MFKLVIAISKRVNVPHVNKTVTDFGDTDIPPVATPLDERCLGNW